MGDDTTNRVPIPLESHDPLWLTEVAGLLIIFLCSAFTFVASFVLLVYFLLSPSAVSSGFFAKLTLKALVFGGIALCGAWRLRRLSSCMISSTARPLPPKPPVYMPIIVAAFALLLVATFSFVHLERYPRVEPDEAHHLIVARNLAEYGMYASGRPDTGFISFDEYDSVGPPVLAPVAAAMRVLGTGVLPARVVMASYYLLLCVLLYAAMRSLAGSVSASICVILAFGAPGSVYLARTLYGEAPALAYLLAGLILWRQSLNRRAAPAWAFAAGIAFGLMVVTKSFMLMTAWAFLGAWVYDRLTFRRIRAVHVLVPGFTVGVIVAAWALAQDAAHAGSPSTAATQFGMYQHNLMFGLRSAHATLGWLMRDPVPLLVGLLSMILFAPSVFVRRYDPVLVVLFLFVPFELYWWVFFTTGSLPRYVWHSLALLSVYPALLLIIALRRTLTPSKGSVSLRLAWLLIALVIALPAARSLTSAGTRVLTHDDTRDERELAVYLRSLPDAATIATTYYPAERTMNLMADRPVALLKAGHDALRGYDVIIVDMQSQRDLLMGEPVSRTFGRYAIVRPRGRAQP